MAPITIQKLEIEEEVSIEFFVVTTFNPRRFTASLRQAIS